MDLKTTGCCALSQISRVNNTTKLAKLKVLIEQKRNEALNENADPYSYAVAQTCLFVVTTESEIPLAKKLKKLGFKEMHTFKRRLCTIKKETQDFIAMGKDLDEVGHTLTMWTLDLL